MFIVNKTALLGIAVCLWTAAAGAQEQQYMLLSREAEQDVELTADPNTPFWTNCPPVFIRHSILGAPATNLHAEIRSRWTQENLYFLFIAQYETLNLRTNANTESETHRLWLHDCMEVYVGVDPEHPNLYRGFQMSPLGEFLDLNIDSTRPRPGYGDEHLWDSGMKVKARIDEKAKIWYGEMQIPMKSINLPLPRPGIEVSVNFCRQDGRQSRTFMAWQPTGEWTPHRPEKFGTLRLVDGGNAGP